LFNDGEIIADVRHFPKEDEEENGDEGENDSQLKFSNNHAFECYIQKNLLEEQCDSSELMISIKLCSRTTKHSMTNLCQMKLLFKC